VKPLGDLPTSFECLMTKGKKDRLKLEGLAHFFCFILSEKIGLSNFTQQNFHLSFHFLSHVDLKTLCNVCNFELRLVIAISTSIMLTNEFMFFLSYSCLSVYFLMPEIQ
jgi:hypothetical protein